MTLRLYVWTGFKRDFSDGLAFAIADSEEDARRQIKDKMGCSDNDWGELSVHPLNRRTCEGVYGGG